MFQKNETCKALKESHLMSNIPKRNLVSAYHLLKKNWSTFMEDYSTQLQTYTSNRVHIIQIPIAAPSFMGIWAIWSPLKIHCYTCMSFETCWSRLIYMKLSSHRSFVINMYVVTMAWHCISPWSFYRSLQKRREIDIFRICQQISAHSEVKTTEKKKRTSDRSNSHERRCSTRNLYDMH